MSDLHDPLPTPPLTKRGCLTPNPSSTGHENDRSDQVLFHLDYLKLTVFSSYDEVRTAVEAGLYEASHAEYVPWVNKGQGKRWESININVGPVAILVPKDEGQGYCVVELKGEACARFSSEQLQGLMWYLGDLELRWHGTRVDLAFDYVAFSPHMMRDAIEREDFNSRCLRFTDRDWNENHEGATAYLGGRKASKDRKLRVYDRRGYNRCEGEFVRMWARTVARNLMNTEVSEWPKLAVGFLRGMVDFVDRSVDERVERCTLLAWWSEFVGDVEKIRQLDDEDRRRKAEQDMLDVVAETERRIERVARQLLPISLALGPGYLHDRLNEHGAEKLKSEDEDLIIELRKIGKAGVIQWLRDRQEELDFTPF